MNRFILNKHNVFFKCKYHVSMLMVQIVTVSAFDIPKVSDTWKKYFKSNAFAVEMISLSILQLQENRLSPLFIALVLLGNPL